MLTTLGRLARTVAMVLPIALTARAAPAQVTVGRADDVIVVMPQNSRVLWRQGHPRREPQPVTLKSVAADVQVNDQVSTTTLVMTLANSGGSPMEAQVLVPVPDGATIRSFQLDSLGSEPTAKLLPRDEARRVYTSIVAGMKDPGLLEFINCSLIRSSVFPIPAGGENTVRLTYEVILQADGDRVDYVLPRTEALTPTGVVWTLSMDIRSTRPISTVYSPSHDLVTQRVDAGHVIVKATAQSAANPGSFRVSYLQQPAGADAVSATLLTYPDPELGKDGGYFLLLAGLPAEPARDRAPVKREVTIVIDRSGSMRGEKMDQAREACRQVVEGLHDGEFFNIIDYSDSIASFSDWPVAKSKESIEKARAYIAALTANGGTNIHDALLEALRQEPTPGTLPVVLFLTDGLPTVGQTSEVAIREAAEKANTAHRRIFSFGVGFDVNAPLLTGVAKAARGTSTFVLPEEDVEVKVGQVFRRLSGPVLDTPKLTAVVVPQGGVAMRPIREVQPGTLPDLFEGDQLVVLGQYTDDSAKRLVLEGNYLGEPRRFEFSFDTSKASARNSFVPRLWATRKIGSLLEEIRQAGAAAVVMPGVTPTENPRTKELVDEVVRLSTKWGILTEYTAFLAVEPEQLTRAGLGAGRYEISGGAGDGKDLYLLAPQEAAAPAARMDEAQVRKSAGANIQARVVAGRLGKEAVNQDMNLVAQAAATCENKLNTFWTADMKKVGVLSVCQVADRTLYQRGTRWVDSRVLKDENEAPQRTVEFASDEYHEIVTDLAKANRQGMLALGGDVYLLYRGQRVLVKGPATE
ncbi:MAG: VWA domain-containing protein [Phycisphaerales bacterium]|nr:VWA domain-containing protein [Phycisphaerales bacterium]